MLVLGISRESSEHPTQLVRVVEIPINDDCIENNPVNSVIHPIMDILLDTLSILIVDDRITPNCLVYKEPLIKTTYDETDRILVSDVVLNQLGELGIVDRGYSNLCYMESYRNINWFRFL